MNTTSFQSAYLDAIEQLRDANRHHPPDQTVRVEGQLHQFKAFYERIRSLVDYQEERFIRRLAIRRILGRRLLIEHQRDNVGIDLVKELISAAYLKNGSVQTSVAADIDTLLAKYIASLGVIDRAYAAPENIRLQRRLLGIAAAEIEDLLQPSQIEQVLTERLAEEMASYGNGQVEEHTRIIALRAYLKADAELMIWRLVGQSNDQLWQDFTAEPAVTVRRLLKKLTTLKARAHSQDAQTQIRRFRFLLPPYKVLSNIAYAAPKEAASIINNEKRLTMALQSQVETHRHHTQDRIRRAMLRSTLYIFITKIIVGLAIEVPYDQLTAGQIAYGPLVVNILTPPALMLLATVGVRPPSQDNTHVLVRRAKKIVTGADLDPLPDVQRISRFSGSSSTVFALLYALLYLLIFGGIVWLLSANGFNIVSIAIFLFFVSVVGFFAYRIRLSAKELAVQRERGGVLSSIVDFFALPFLQVGQWLSLTARQLNVVLFVMDFLIEAPFKIFLQVLEDWFAFLREKREELH